VLGQQCRGDIAGRPVGEDGIRAPRGGVRGQRVGALFYLPAGSRSPDAGERAGWGQSQSLLRDAVIERGPLRGLRAYNAARATPARRVCAGGEVAARLRVVKGCGSASSPESTTDDQSSAHRHDSVAAGHPEEMRSPICLAALARGYTSTGATPGRGAGAGLRTTLESFACLQFQQELLRVQPAAVSRSPIHRTRLPDASAREEIGFLPLARHGRNGSVGRPGGPVRRRKSFPVRDLRSADTPVAERGRGYTSSTRGRSNSVRSPSKYSSSWRPHPQRETRLGNGRANASDPAGVAGDRPSPGQASPRSRRKG